MPMHTRPSDARGWLSRVARRSSLVRTAGYGAEAAALIQLRNLPTRIWVNPAAVLAADVVADAGALPR